MPNSTAPSILLPLTCPNDAVLLGTSVQYSFTLAQDIIVCRMRKFTWQLVKSKSSVFRCRKGHPTSQILNGFFKDYQFNTDMFLVLLDVR